MAVMRPDPTQGYFLGRGIIHRAPANRVLLTYMAHVVLYMVFRLAGVAQSGRAADL
jgi:hypothetical protein